WKEVSESLKIRGIDVPASAVIDDQIQMNEQTKVTNKGGKCEPVPINKVGNYCEGDDGNTTILAEYKGVKNMASILDSGAGVAIATKEVWESWG
ncbi:hypothetical protein, partial [Escherichia coli]|uniref:hypothetical protein n=1 Tax=Escherichia coli TaxID=562 RepID=UPI001AD8F082